MIEKKHLPEKSNPVMIFHDAHELDLEYFLLWSVYSGFVRING
jgi:hypothetical protein